MMAAAAIFGFETLTPFIYYAYTPNQIWWERCDSDIEVSKNCSVIKIQEWRLTPSWILKNCCQIFAI